MTISNEADRVVTLNLSDDTDTKKIKAADEEQKYKALNDLKIKLDGNGLIRVHISQKNKSGKWEI